MSAVELYTKGARVWLPDTDFIWRGAELLEDFKSAPCKIKVQYEEAETPLQDLHLHRKLEKETESVIEIKDKSKLPHLRNPEILIGENDLTSLSYLNEPEVLYNLKVRLEERNIIYTYCDVLHEPCNKIKRTTPELESFNNHFLMNAPQQCLQIQKNNNWPVSLMETKKYEDIPDLLMEYCAGILCWKSGFKIMCRLRTTVHNTFVPPLLQHLYHQQRS